LPVPHGPAEVNGYLFSRSGRNLIAYLSDCSAVPDDIAQNIFRVECLIIDALREKPHPTHLSVAQAVEVAARVQPKETYFTHIAHELPQSFEKNLPQHIHMAYDGLKLSFRCRSLFTCSSSFSWAVTRKHSLPIIYRHKQSSTPTPTFPIKNNSRNI